MILDLLPRHALYAGDQGDISRGFAWLERFSQNTPDGRYEITGSRVYALVQSYNTAVPVEKQYESHRNYIDIQYVAAGTEIIYYAPVDRLAPITDYHVEKDFQLYADPSAATSLHLSAGSFAVFHPMDGHKPGCIDGVSNRVQKVVIKVRCN